MRRPLFKACLGSWCVQLVFNPRREPGVRPFAALRGVRTGGATPLLESPELSPASEARTLWPAFAAVIAAVGANCYALGEFLHSSPLKSVLWAFFIAVALVAVGAHCFSACGRSVCQKLRVPLGAVMLVAALWLQWNAFQVAKADGENHVFVALFVGFVTLFSLLLAGTRSGGRVVPLSAPLIPGLALFGLLCLVWVDSRLLLSFFVWASAAIYGVVYAHTLRVVRPDLALGTRLVARPLSSTNAPLHPAARTGARQSVLAGGVWLGLFLLGGVLFWVPVRWTLPRVSSSIGGIRVASQASTNDNASVMAVQGGNRLLSSRAVLRVTMQQGQPSGLWRGRVFTRYNFSRWEAENFSEHPPHQPAPWKLTATAVSSPFRSRSAPTLNAAQGHVRPVLERMEPLEPARSAIYASGQFISRYQNVEGAPFAENWSDGASDESVRAPYLVRSLVVEPNILALSRAPGYRDVAPDAAHRLEIESALQRPDAESLRLSLQIVAGQIVRSKRGGAARFSSCTPWEKARAISNYLTANCVYSLQAPTVPAGRDATEFFLLDSRAGACDMFASSMALLLREMDVPARVVTGYLLVDDAASPVAVVDGRPVYTVRERDAHAWVEYYVPRFGWITFDPTQGTREQAASMPTSLAVWHELPSWNRISLWAIAPLLAVALAGWNARRRNAPCPNDTFVDERRRHIEKVYARALQLLRVKVPHSPALSPGQYEARVGRAAIGSQAKQEFAALTHLFVAARYGEVPDVSEKDVSACLKRLERALHKSN